METEELSELAQIMTGQTETPPDPAEGRTDQEESENEDSPLAAEADEPEQSDAESEGTEESPEPLTMKALAEKLEMRPQDVYKAELVPGLTLGAAKDQAKDLLRAQEILAETEEKRISTENELQAKIRDNLLAQANPDLTPEQRREAYNNGIKEANATAVRTIDGWTDPAVMQNDLNAISELLAEYGRTQDEIRHVIDPRDLKLLTDYTRLRSRIRSATETEVKPKRKQNAKNRNRSVQKPRDRITSQYNKGEISQGDAIRQLITGR